MKNPAPPQDGPFYKEEPMRYAEYLRKSRADDPGEPIETTLHRHREALLKCMESHGIHVAPEDVFEEVASGDSLYARPQMLRLLERVERGDYAGVLCMDIQRLGRGSMSDQGAILDAFKASRTKIITPSKVYDLSDEKQIPPYRYMGTRKTSSRNSAGFAPFSL